MKKTAIITGATKGIGRAVVDEFASKGLSIIFCARNKTEALALQNELANQYPKQRFFAKAVDMSKKDEVLDFYAFVEGLNLPVDILVNNAGVFLPGELATEEDHILETQLNTNLKSAYHMSRAVLPEMKRRKAGHIVNMCSVASITAYPNGGSYCISKFALYGFSKVLREELKEDNIRVTAVLPGATWSASWEGSGVPPERMMKAASIAKMIYSAIELGEDAVVEDIVLRPQLGDI